MKISRTKFIITFLISAFVFQFITNSVLGPEVKLFPANGDWFPGDGSPIAWQNTLATIIYPIKFVLITPLSFLAKDPGSSTPCFTSFVCLLLDCYGISASFLDQ
ncbi:hypothetical protein [Pedobacter sp. UC225_65]|uniref:hypothetical protein n=1 Tax=Pedobacter sp. UC225_65 TaxID=3350173 RepID=UPI00366B6BA4